MPNIEKEIQAKQLNAPRVSLADLEANIADVEIVKHISKMGQVLRWAVILPIMAMQSWASLPVQCP